MININGIEWKELTNEDIVKALSEQDFDESFYFEFKEDRVSNKTVIEEISAFANTFGGYIFLGVSNNKDILGCSFWNEQRIHTLIHDSITPTPSFDVKKFTIGINVIYVIKIDEGAEPPYVTSSGKIYERLSSGSFTIKDSAKLTQIFNKKERLLEKMERKISIPPIQRNVDNIYGYIDIGFCLVSSDIQTMLDTFNNVDLKSCASELKGNSSSFSLSRIGNSIVYIPGGLSTHKGHLPAHTNNFIEIMADGSARMRILLTNNDANDPRVNLVYADSVLSLYEKVYKKIMGKLFPDKVVYAKKYESLTVLKQFQPIYFYDDDVLKFHPDWAERNKSIFETIRLYQSSFGIKTVVTDDRIPKVGLYLVDKHTIESFGIEFGSESFLGVLFFSNFASLGDYSIPDSEGE